MGKMIQPKYYGRILRRVVAAAIIFPPLMASTSVRQDFDLVKTARLWISELQPSSPFPKFESAEGGIHWSERQCR